MLSVEDAVVNKTDVLPPFLELIVLLVRVKVPKMVKRKGIVDTSRRPNSRITGIPEREHH